MVSYVISSVFNVIKRLHKDGVPRKYFGHRWVIVDQYYAPDISVHVIQSLYNQISAQLAMCRPKLVTNRILVNGQ